MSSTRVVAAIALGSNLGDREKFLRSALTRLDRTAGIVVLRRSTWHETEPDGGPEGQGPFLNGVVLVETSLDAHSLLAVLQGLELKAGRERGVPNAPRTLDLDLLWFGDEHCEIPELTLPHPRMEQRTFVLAPLAELAPDHLLGCGQTVSERLVQLTEACS